MTTEKLKRVRPSKDDYYLGLAKAVAQRSTCLRKQYGAVIVKDDRPVGMGYNGSPCNEPNCCDVNFCQREHLNVPSGERYELCEAVHAEENAIISAGRDRTIGATLYLYGETDGVPLEDKYQRPCLLCSRAIKNAGIAHVVAYQNKKEG